MAVAKRFQNGDYVNWLKVSQGLKDLRDGLCPYVDAKTKALHKTILKDASIKQNAQCKGSCNNKQITGKWNQVWAFSQHKCPQVCDKILVEIQKHHTEDMAWKVHWRNSDFTKWTDTNTGYWEIAKLFMGIGQPPDNTGSKKTDASNILTLMLQCKDIRNDFNTTEQDKMKKIREDRNKLMHSPTLEMIDSDTSEALEQMISLLQDVMKLQNDARVQEAIDNIDKIKRLTSNEIWQNEELALITEHLKAIEGSVKNIEEKENSEEIQKVKDTAESCLEYLNKSGITDLYDDKLKPSISSIKDGINDLHKVLLDLTTIVDEVKEGVADLKEHQSAAFMGIEAQLTDVNKGQIDVKEQLAGMATDVTALSKRIPGKKTKLSESDISDIKQCLQNVYQNQTFYCFEKLPGEPFQLDLSQEDVVMPLEVIGTQGTNTKHQGKIHASTAQRTDHFTDLSKLSNERIQSKLEIGHSRSNIAIWFASSSITRILKDFDFEGFVSNLQDELILTPEESNELTTPRERICEKADKWSRLCEKLQDKQRDDINQFLEVLKKDEATTPLAEYIHRVLDKCDECPSQTTDSIASPQLTHTADIEINGGHGNPSERNMYNTIKDKSADFIKNLISYIARRIAVVRKCITITVAMDEWDLDNLQKDIACGVFVQKLRSWLRKQGLEVPMNSDIDVKIQNIQEYVKDNDTEKTAEMRMLSESDISGVKQCLQEVYQKPTFYRFEKFPGEPFRLDLSQEDAVMPLHVSVEVVSKTTRQQMSLLDESSIKYQYESETTVTEIDEVFSLDQKEQSGTRSIFRNRLYIATGIAGTGKTVTQKRFAWQFSSGSNQHLQRFNMVFYIPVRHVNIKSKIMNMLCEELNYIPVDMKEALHKYLVNSPDSRNVLFGLDGVDEVSIPTGSELYQLITGKLYTKASVFITARPEAEILKRKELKPDVKIKINGTNKTGMRSHIKTTMAHGNENPPSEEDVDILIERGESHKMVMLLIPLYLTQMTTVFINHWVKFASFAEYRVPETMTQLFNQFAIILIRRWAQRRKSAKTQEPNEVEIMFTRHPFEPESTVPADIQRIFIQIGLMSFECLRKQKYHFSEKDLKRYLLSLSDIKESGMFCTGENGSVFFKHKTLQEYASACYLSYHKCKVVAFKEFVNRDENDPDEDYSYYSEENEGGQEYQEYQSTMKEWLLSMRQSNRDKVIDGKPSIQRLFEGLELVMKMVVGMVPDVGVEILSALSQKTKLATISNKYTDYEDIQVSHYELELQRESQDDAFQKAMDEYLEQQIKEFEKEYYDETLESDEETVESDETIE